MVEDALKLTRTLHRLIIAVSGITLVFAFSISLPVDKVRQRAEVEALLSADFQSYRDFVDAEVAKVIEEPLQSVADDFERIIARSDAMVLNDFELTNHFRKPVHVGRVLVEDLVLADMSASTLTQLDALNGLSLESDVQVVLPRADIAHEIAQFFESAPGARRVTDIGLGIDGPEWTAESFLPDTDTAIAVLAFELPASVNPGATPVFQAQFECDVVVLEGTSFLGWLQDNPHLGQLVEVANGRVHFGSDLADLPTGARENSLGEIATELSREIAQLGPDQQTATFLGTAVPGRLVLIAAPLVIIALQYYFCSHTRHLVRLSGQDKKTFSQFAWLPLIIGEDLPQTWKAESAATIIAAPLIALGVLLYRLSAFGDISFRTALWAAAAGFATLLLGMSSLEHIGTVREQMRSNE